MITPLGAIDLEPARIWTGADVPPPRPGGRLLRWLPRWLACLPRHRAMPDAGPSGSDPGPLPHPARIAAVAPTCAFGPGADPLAPLRQLPDPGARRCGGRLR